LNTGNNDHALVDVGMGKSTIASPPELLPRNGDQL